VNKPSPKKTSSLEPSATNKQQPNESPNVAVVAKQPSKQVEVLLKVNNPTLGLPQ
jgi:hypothetical protein